MSENCTHDCGSCSANCSERKGPQDFIEKPHAMSKVKKIIGVVSGKGGVGKTMVTSMLAVMMNRRGAHAAILDADVTGPSIAKVFGIKSKAEVCGDGLLPARTETGIDIMSVNMLLENDTDPVIWRGPVIAGVVKQFWTDVIWHDVDYLFIDMPPGTGDVPLTVFQSIPIDGIIVVTSPQDLVSMIVGKAINMARQMNIPVLGLIENYSFTTCPDCGKRIPLFGESHFQQVALQYRTGMLGQLPLDPKLAALCDAGEIEGFEGDWLEGAANVIERL